MNRLQVHGFLLCLLGVAGCAGEALLPGEANASDDEQVAEQTQAVLDGWWSWTPLTNGRLGVRFINNYTGVDMRFEKTGGSCIYGRFGYSSGSWTHYDNGKVRYCIGDKFSFAWNGTNPGSCVRGFFDVDGQGRIFANTICRG